MNRAAMSLQSSSWEEHVRQALSRPQGPLLLVSQSPGRKLYWEWEAQLQASPPELCPSHLAPSPSQSSPCKAAPPSSISQTHSQSCCYSAVSLSAWGRKKWSDRCPRGKEEHSAEARGPATELGQLLSPKRSSFTPSPWALVST